MAKKATSTAAAKSAGKAAPKAAAKAAPKAAAKSTPKKAADLGLIEHAASAAIKLETDNPSVVFTSGTRTPRQQADAMASNVVLNRNWIKETYRKTPQRDELQAWVDAHSEATSKKAVGDGLYAIINGWTPEEQMNLSRHIGGLAFDVQPVDGAAGVKIKTAIEALPNLKIFLTEEGGLVRWHAEFKRKV